jgi:TPP-dependent indolepyruvate ferredoxin oxidoreductase alpha subunit
MNRIAAVVLAAAIPVLCPDCPYTASILEMAEHYKKTGHGRR